jgi:hypothetical protein
MLAPELMLGWRSSARHAECQDAGATGPFSLAGTVQSRNAAEVGGTVLSFGKVFVAVQTDGHADLGFCRLAFVVSRRVSRFPWSAGFQPLSRRV